MRFYKICKRMPIIAIAFIAIEIVMSNAQASVCFIEFLFSLVLYGVGEVIEELQRINTFLLDNAPNKTDNQ